MNHTVGACCLLVPLLGTMGCTEPQAAPAAEPVASAPADDGLVRIAQASQPFIVVETVGQDDVGTVLTVPARVAFRDGAVSQIGAPLAGRVTRVDVRTGDVVKAGDPLIVLDCPEAASVRAAVKTASASLHEAKVAAARERRMLDQGVGSERETLEAETKVSELEAELARAQAAAASVGAEAGTTVVLSSPISGSVVSRIATEGMAVQPGGEPLVEIGNLSDLWVVGDVFERDLAFVREGAQAHIECPSINGDLKGHITSIGGVVTSGLRTAPVRVTLDSDGARLRPGMYGRVRLDGAGTGGLSLPTEAVLIKGKESMVFVQKDPLTFERRTVTVGRPVEGHVQVLSGLSAQDKVVVRGALFLDGAADQLI